jgi:hypothetical protein
MYSGLESVIYFYTCFIFCYVIGWLAVDKYSGRLFRLKNINRMPNFLFLVTRSIFIAAVIVIIFGYIEWKPLSQEIYTIPEVLKMGVFRINFPIINFIYALFVYFLFFYFYLFFWFYYVNDLLIDYFQQNYEIIIFFFHLFFLFFLLFYFDILLNYYWITV